MKIDIQSGDILKRRATLAVLGSFEDVPLPADVADLLVPGDFSGRQGQTLLLYPRGAVAPKRLLLVGLGKREKASMRNHPAGKRHRHQRSPKITGGRDHHRRERRNAA